jgi:septum formation topological specificity factor MinE
VAGDLVRTAPSLAAAKELLPAEQFESLRADIMELVRRWNQADDGSLRIDSKYLLTVARKP